MRSFLRVHWSLCHMEQFEQIVSQTLALTYDGLRRRGQSGTKLATGHPYKPPSVSSCPRVKRALFRVTRARSPSLSSLKSKREGLDTKDLLELPNLHATQHGRCANLFDPTGNDCSKHKLDASFVLAPLSTATTCECRSMFDIRNVCHQSARKLQAI